MKTYKVIGCMSGTSLDGLDLIYAHFFKEKETNKWQFEIRKGETISYDSFWRDRLKNAIHLSGLELTKLDIEFGIFIGEAVQEFKEKNQIKEVDFIASHGHTIFHQPNKGFTLQIGSGIQIKTITKNKVIYDFRTQDVALGGQGAPLVPVGDQLLFSDYDYCLNLGGFANVSYQNKEDRIAYDICPVNVVSNFYAQQLGKPYDDKGVFGKEGKVLPELLNQLNRLSFYKQNPPKSLGIEWVNQFIFSLLKPYENPKDILATWYESIAIQLASQIKEGSVLVTGGGTYNSYLLELFQSKTKAKIVLADSDVIEFKEALIFAFLGVLKLENQPNCLQSVTGASKNHSSGIIIN